MPFPPRLRTPAGTDAVPGGRRIPEVDVLRGFALLGILLVNAQAMAGPRLDPAGGPAASRADEVAAWLLTMLVSGKFYLLFAFLFGYCLTRQRLSAERAGAPFAPRHLRRLCCLFALGTVHGAVLFRGDILVTYAVLSLVLYAARDIALRTAVRTAAGLVAVVAAFLLTWGLCTVAVAAPPDPRHAAAATRAAAAAYQGEPAAVVLANLRSLRDTLGWNVLYGADVLAACLLGVAAGRRRLLAGTGRHRAPMVRTVACALPLGLAGGVLTAICRNGPLDARWYDVGSAVGVLTAPALTAAYACGLLLLLGARPGRRVAGVLAAAGRLSLTHYLTQSLVMALVFTGHGLGWYGRHGTVAVLAGALLLYAAQLSAGPWLLRRARYGPAEWLLRAATLARRP
ncbi:DUF418 domain-containing protein [Streptomyces sp. NPDC004134]|uniref:DUF418 domain-containing protein n=1 Tax=Streptomyces sp. NPDC004134 TaxID=3364691 RepID=UPI0036C5A6E7